MWNHKEQADAHNGIPGINDLHCHGENETVSWLCKPARGWQQQGKKALGKLSLSTAEEIC